MTVQQAREKLLSVARGELGYRESGVNRHKYAAEMAAAYGWDVQGQPWCDIFVDYCFVRAFGLAAAAKMTCQSAGNFSALCSASAARYQEKGAWNTFPEPGDQIFFRRGGEIEHTGLVESVNGLVVTTIEGNSDDCVARRSYALGSPSIAGFGRPDWTAAAAEAPACAETAGEREKAAFRYHPHSYRVEIALLKQGDYGPQVERLQQLLTANGFPCGTDGQFGGETCAALKRFQRAAGVTPDGEFGGESFAALRDYEGGRAG